MDANAASATNNRKYCNGMAAPSVLPSVEHRKKSWSELKESVTDLRKQLSRLATMIPMNIEFRRLTDGRTRIYFLSMPPNGWETTLLCTDIPPTVNETHDSSQATSQRQRLISSNRPNFADISSCRIPIYAVFFSFSFSCSFLLRFVFVVFTVHRWHIDCSGNCCWSHRCRIYRQAIRTRAPFNCCWNESGCQRGASHLMKYTNAAAASYFPHRVRCTSA